MIEDSCIVLFKDITYVVKMTYSREVNVAYEADRDCKCGVKSEIERIKALEKPEDDPVDDPDDEDVDDPDNDAVDNSVLTKNYYNENGEVLICTCYYLHCYSIEVLRHGVVKYNICQPDGIDDVYKLLRDSFSRNLVSLEESDFYSRIKINIPYYSDGARKVYTTMLFQNIVSLKRKDLMLKNSNMDNSDSSQSDEYVEENVEIKKVTPVENTVEKVTPVNNSPVNNSTTKISLDEVNPITFEEKYNTLMKEYQILDKYCTELERKNIILEKRHIAISIERDTAEAARDRAETECRVVTLDYRALRRKYTDHINKYDC